MKCEFYELLRRGGHVFPKDCEIEATNILPEDDHHWRMCPKHFDVMVGVMKNWLNGGSTYRHEMMAKRYFEKHPELS
jgi:hypothetical protein